MEAFSTATVNPTVLGGDDIHVVGAFANSDAQVMVRAGSSIQAGGNLSIHALSTVTANAVIQPEAAGGETTCGCGRAIHDSQRFQVGIEGNSNLTTPTSTSTPKTKSVTTTANASTPRPVRRWQ
jgi:hypothetical protein